MLIMRIDFDVDVDIAEWWVMGKDKPPTGSLYPRESIVCFFLFVVELATVSST